MKNLRKYVDGYIDLFNIYDVNTLNNQATKIYFYTTSTSLKLKLYLAIRIGTGLLASRIGFISTISITTCSYEWLDQLNLVPYSVGLHNPYI